jgi:hypothetical protein
MVESGKVGKFRGQNVELKDECDLLEKKVGEEWQNEMEIF